MPATFKYIIQYSDNRFEYFRKEKILQWSNNYTEIGSFNLNVKVYMYPFFNNIYGWKIAEKTITVEIRGYFFINYIFFCY